MTFAIVTDTACDVPENILDQIYLVPTKIILDGVEYSDFDIKKEDLIARFREKRFANSSLPSPGDFLEVYEKATEKYDKILGINLSSGLSGTFNSARLASQQLENVDITVIDSQSITIAAGYLVALAVYMREKGFSFEETIKAVEYAKTKVKLFIHIDTPDNLHYSGRVNLAQFKFLKYLHLRPILTNKDGMLVIDAIGFGRKNSYKKIANKVINLARNYKNPIILMGYVDYFPDISHYENLISDLDYNNKFVVSICSSLCVHAGERGSGLGIAEGFDEIIEKQKLIEEKK